MKPEYFLLYSLSKALSENKVLKLLCLELALDAKQINNDIASEMTEYLQKRIEKDVEEDLKARFQLYLSIYNKLAQSAGAGDEGKSPQLSDLTAEELLRLLSDQIPPQSLS